MKYTRSHEWVRKEGNMVTIGITDIAQRELGDIVYVELPKVGHEIQAGEEVVVLESTKAAIDLYTPVSGTITAVNKSLEESPETINSSPEKEGWIYQITLSNVQELDLLLDEKAYKEMLEQNE